MKKLSSLFEIKQGHSLELNKLAITSPNKGVAFVSRKTGDNGIAAYVKQIPDVDPYPAGELTCALSGNGVLSTFIQDRPFYTAYHVASLKPKVELSTAELLYYCACIRANHYRYGWGRQANRSIKDLLIPDVSEIPKSVKTASIERFPGANAPASNRPAPRLSTANWKTFEYQDLFVLERGQGPRFKDLDGTGSTPFVTSTDSDNGVTGFTSMAHRHNGNTIGVNRNGSVGEAFYQPVPFCSTEDVHVFNPKFPMTPFVGLFLSTLIRLERFRFGYGRKWGMERMKETKIKLPITKAGIPDWEFMERYIKSLPFSSQI